MIIEEPEAHLHPANQRILAKYLVKLIRNGVILIITTHSDILIEQLSSFILLSKIESKNRTKKYHYDENDFLNFNEIATYVFNQGEKGEGSTITQVPVTEEEGISDSEFEKIQESLFEESIRIRRGLDRD